MDPHTLAEALRQRQYTSAGVPRALVDALSDEAIIRAYITCFSCGTTQVTPEALPVVIAAASDVQDFFRRCDVTSRRCHA